MLGFDSFGQIDLSAKDWMAPAWTPLSPAGEGRSEEVLDPPPVKLIAGQPYLTGSKGESRT